MGENDLIPELETSYVTTFSKGKSGKTCRVLSYSFYKKPMGSIYSVLETISLTNNIKVNSLTQEVIRRILNTSEYESQEDKGS